MARISFSTNLNYGRDMRQQLDVAVPETATASGLVLALHGGWWCRGDRRDLRSTALALAEQGYASACVGYNLLTAGDRDGGDLVNDVVAAAKVALEQYTLEGGDGNSLVLLGSGAGGLLALAAATALSEAQYHIKGVCIAGTTPSLKPWEGASDEVVRQLQRFAGTNPEAREPLELAKGKLPPVLLLHGDGDHDVSVTQAQTLHDALIAEGEIAKLTVLAGAGHRFIEQAHSAAGAGAIKSLVSWLGELDSLNASNDGPLVGEPDFLK